MNWLSPHTVGANPCRQRQQPLMDAVAVREETLMRRKFPKKGPKPSEMEDVLENVVALVRQHPDGIPLKKLSMYYNQTYRTNLAIRDLNFTSNLSMVSSLEDLVVEGQLVFHKDHRPQSPDAAGAECRPPAPQPEAVTKAKKKEKKTEKALQNVVDLIKELPEGIPLENVAIVYRQKYKKKLSPPALGFQTVSRMVESLKEDLVLQGEMVFHRMYLPESRPAAGTSTKIKVGSRPQTPKTPDSLKESRSSHPGNQVAASLWEKSPHGVSVPQSGVNLIGSPLMASGSSSSAHIIFGSPPVAASPPAKPLTQDQLFGRVLEIIKTYKLATPTMEQLHTYYPQMFGEPFPLRQYMTLYDNVEAGKKLSAPAESAANSKADAWQTSKATQNRKEGAAEEPSLLLEQDFPVLGASAPAAKEKKSKAKEDSQREAGAAVFRERHYAQQREVHGGNMRALEAMEEDNEDPRSRRRNRSVDPEWINSVTESAIREIASEGELVTKEKVISRVCRMIPTLDPGMLKPWTVPALKDLLYLTREINMFIEAAEAVTSICTLYELGQMLAGLKDKKCYQELNLGPLCKLPLVHRMFKIDSNTKDDDIHEIETVHILKQINIFRRKHLKQRLDLADFMKHLADHYNCESPYELGIRIHSFGLPISSLIKVSRCEQTILERAREVIQKELEEETMERLKKIKKSVLEPMQGVGSFSSTGNSDLRKKYASMTAADVVLEVFSNAQGVFSSRMAKHVQSFLVEVSADRLARALFQLAVCGGSLAVPQDLVLKDKTPKTSAEAKTGDPAAPALPSEAKVKQYVKEQLGAQKSVVTLANIAALEKKLAKHFHVKDFFSLEQGTFLDFLVKHIQLLQETLGSALFLGTNVELTGSGFRPSRQDVFEFIKQCGTTSSSGPDELAHIEAALRSHYRIRDSRDLGYGTLHMLADLVKRQRELIGGGGGLSPVYYESALLAKNSKSSVESGYESVGRLGDMSKDQALASLLSCPLLEDLNNWSQWELIFKPLHGPLKDFIERNAANTGLAVLEVSPGLLLRITTDTGDKHFTSAAAALDPVTTAGHLVSMVAADGIDNAPLALLANHMQNSLAAAVAEEDLSRAEEDVTCYSRVATFLLRCLTRIPTRTCQALLQQVFLEPFSRVLGQAKSKEVLITVAQADPKHLSCLHRLGILLGITDWVKDYQKKLTPPQSQSNNVYAAARRDHAKPNLTDSDSSSLSALNMSEDESLDDDIMDSNSVSSQLNQGIQQDVPLVNGDQSRELDEQEDEEEEEEELYELASIPNGETSNISSEAECGQSEEQLDSSDTDSCQAGHASPLQKNVIEDIRKSEFGIGVELNAEGQKLMQVHQERLGRSLDRLSTELYSKDTHFVLELIQNADDNSYPAEGGVVPALAFVVERDCITVLNNETGFQEKNIRAICDVGRSTKGKHKYGYIGQKGIGFKSVFKVTDCPEIHSNGFHLRFDRNCGPMGYILPHWTEEERPLDAQLKDIHRHSWTTKICLPLRSESHQTRNLFHDVHPSLLLFLHRLRSITIYNQSEKRLVTMTRKDLSHNLLEVEHTEGTERWLVVKTTLQPKKIKEDVESTELALAFQLGGNEAETDIVCQPQKQPVFAYLPLRSFGFRFIIQGDFDIPSSREDVDRDSSWNQWLRSEIPQLFLKAMDVFTAHPDYTGLKGLCQFLHFIPLPDEVLDFFKPVAGQIIQLLKGRPFLPTLTSGGTVVYKLPSQVAVCQDAVIRDVISGDELERHLSLSYLHPGLSPPPPRSLLTHMGVRYLRGSDVTTVTTAMAKELVRAEGINSEEGLRQLARLLVCNFRAMEHGYGEAESILQNLRGLTVIALADGRVVALSEESVFFPMEEAKTKKEKKAQTQTGPLSALYQDLNVVHPSLLNCLPPLESQQVRELLKRLGVHELEPQELLEQHIYPTINSIKWKSKPEPVVVSYLVFIKRHSSSGQEYSDIAVPVLTSRGLLCPFTERVHFSKEYDNMDLPQMLPGCDWILLSPCYVETDGDVEGWRELFSRLGVRDGLIIRRERRTLAPEELASSPWLAESATWHQSPGKDRVLDDYPCEEFHALATAQLPGSVLLQQRMFLLQLLEANWDSGHRYSQYLTAQVIDGDGRPTKNTRSSFYHLLCSLEWVPAYHQVEDGKPERGYLCPSSVYLTSPEVTSLLGTHVFYVDIRSSDFSRALGMRETVSVEVLIQYLKEWCIKPEEDNQEQRSAVDETEGAYFTSSIKHIHNVYTYLKDKCSQSSLKELFQLIPAVFIEYKRLSDDWCSGRFYHLKEVCWSDNTSMFQRYKLLTQKEDSPFLQPKVLAPFYSQLDGMRDFFLNLLNIDESPNMKQYVGLLELICSSASIPTAELLQDVSILYAKLAQKCKRKVSGDQDGIPETRFDKSYGSQLKVMVSDKKVFPTKDGWVSLTRKPMIGDDKELEKIFKPHKEVCLLYLPPPEKRAVSRTKTDPTVAGDPATRPAFIEKDRLLFLEICGIRQLSHCVTSEPQTENWRPCPSMQSLVRSVVPYIQRFLYHHDELADVYSQLVDRNIAEKLKRLSFGQVGKLYTRYQLDVAGSEVPVIELQDVICLLNGEKELYIQKDHISEKLEILSELVKLFCTESSHRTELKHFLTMVINSNPKALERLLSKKDIGELPSDEEQWEVPEPITPEPTMDRVFSRSLSSISPAEEPNGPAQPDGEQTLVCWPPRASLLNTSSSRAGQPKSEAVEAVLKMWPPPAAPKDRDTEKEDGPGRRSCEGDQAPRSGSRAAHPPGPQRAPSHHTEAAATVSAPKPPEHSQQAETSESQQAEGGEESLAPPRPAPNPPSEQPAESSGAQPPPNSLVGPEAVVPSGTFQGAAAAADPQRPLLNMNFPLWDKELSPQATLEDMELPCQIPSTVVFLDEQMDLAAIGEWGEQLVNSFLCHWRDSGDPARPTHVLWCNQSGESGQPYDFKLTFGEAGAIFVEVKSTLKREKSFIHMSANELDFALKEKERYHIYRVYSAGDARNVRLCRIQNLAQHLHTKDLALFLFV
ncbi:protein NO VEIN isoform X3 [Fundulus heteroclitus]|uniref:protein NO VEIN isoform X3 n=1 Tax=Fundulus heteroclitus TaxID=8078 RepID=UPI00165B27E0|nr:protein NO VEIN isoform X3 [Fundulus heteroclitus]